MNIDYAIISKTGHRSNSEDSVKVMYKSDEARWLDI